MSQSATEIESTTESGGSEMKSFLTNALNAQSEQVDQVMVKIQNAGVSYQDFLQFSEEDLRSVLKQKDLCNISNPLYIGRYFHIQTIFRYHVETNHFQNNLFSINSKNHLESEEY